jgi:cell division protein FtsN
MTTDVRDARSLPEDGFHEIQLSGKQLVFLFMATTVVSVFIFLCGVLVGRNVRTEAAEASQTALAAPSGSLPSTADVAAPAESATTPPPGEPVSETAAEPVPSGKPVPEGKATAGRGYYDQLMSDKPPAETVKAAEDHPVKEPAPPPVARVDSPAPPPPAASPAGGWVVQVTALRQRTEAASIASRLSGRGYKAFVLDPQPGSTSLYRVRVGPFAQRTEAEETVKRLAREEQFNPWISR